MKYAWADALQSAILTKVDKVPPGFQTMFQIAAQIGKSRPRTGELMQIAIAGGNVEVRQFRIKTGQIMRPVPHYRLIK